MGWNGGHAGKGRLVLSKTPCGKVPPPPLSGHASFCMDVPRTFSPRFRTLATPTLGELSSWFPEQLAAPGCGAALERPPAPHDPGASLLAALSRIHGLGPLPRGRPSSQWTPLVKAHVTRGLGVTSSNKTASSLPSLGPQVMGPSSSTSLGWPGVSAADPLPPGSSGSLGIYSELSSDTVHYINPFN